MASYQAPLFLGFSRQEYWSALPCPPSGDLPYSGNRPVPLQSPALAGSFFISSTIWEACFLLSVQFSCLTVSDSLRPHGLQHARLPCPSPTPRAYSKLYVHWVGDAVQPSHPLLSHSVFPSLQSFPASGSFPMSQFFASDGQSIGASASASVLPVNIQDWFPLGWTGCISLQSKGLSRVLSNTTIKQHQLFSPQLSL